MRNAAGFLCAATKATERWRPADVEMAAYFWWSRGVEDCPLTEVANEVHHRFGCHLDASGLWQKFRGLRRMAAVGY